VLCLNVFEYLDDPGFAVSLLPATLKPGGVFGCPGTSPENVNSVWRCCAVVQICTTEKLEVIETIELRTGRQQRAISVRARVGLVKTSGL
jgi:hypothetical protein